MNRFLILIAVLGLGACQTTPPPMSTSAASSQAPFLGSMQDILNQQRAEHGLGPVVENLKLSAAATAHAHDMMARGYFSHVGQNGSTFSDRAGASGYLCAAAENIASGQPTEADVVSAWMNSAGHRRNILLPDAKEFGIGRAGDIWVLMLGRGCWTTSPAT